MLMHSFGTPGWKKAKEEFLSDPKLADCLLSYLTKRCQFSIHDAEDTVQEVFFKFDNIFGKFHTQQANPQTVRISKFVAYLLKSVKYSSLDQKRKEKSETKKLSDYLKTKDQNLFEDELREIEAPSQREKDLSNLYSEVQRLKPLQKRALEELIVDPGRSNEQIALLLSTEEKRQIPPMTTASRLRDARKALKNSLEPAVLERLTADLGRKQIKKRTSSKKRADIR